MLYNDRRDQKETDRRSVELRPEHEYTDADFNRKGSFQDGRQYGPAINARPNSAGRDCFLFEQPDYAVRSKTSGRRIHETIHPHESAGAVLRGRRRSALRLRRGSNIIQPSDKQLLGQQHAADQTEGAVLHSKTARRRLLCQSGVETSCQRSHPFHQRGQQHRLRREVYVDARNLVLLIRSDRGADPKRQHLLSHVRRHTATTKRGDEEI